MRCVMMLTAGIVAIVTMGTAVAPAAHYPRKLAPPWPQLAQTTETPRDETGSWAPAEGNTAVLEQHDAVLGRQVRTSGVPPRRGTSLSAGEAWLMNTSPRSGPLPPLSGLEISLIANHDSWPRPTIAAVSRHSHRAHKCLFLRRHYSPPVGANEPNRSPISCLPAALLWPGPSSSAGLQS